MDRNLEFNKNKKIKIAIIGGSYDSTISKSHLRSILASNKFEIKCGCFSRKENNNGKNSENYFLPKEKIYNNYKKLINSEHKNFNIALILTPPHNKHNIYYELAKKKIGIISEKPFEGNLKKASKIYKFLKKKKLFFLTTYNYLGYPAILEIKNFLKKIGKVNNIILEMPQQASTLNKNIIKKWRTKDLTIPNLHLDLASHLLSIVIYIFNQLPIEVNSFETKNIRKLYVENAYTWLKFKNFVGQFWFSKNATGKRNDLSIKIFGSKGGLEWQHKNPEIINFYDNQGNISIINRLSKNTKYLNNKKLFTYSAGHPSGFLDAFINIYEEAYLLFTKKKKKSTMFLSLKDNLNIISVLDKIYYSSKKNAWQKIILKN